MPIGRVDRLRRCPSQCRPPAQGGAGDVLIFTFILVFVLLEVPRGKWGIDGRVRTEAVSKLATEWLYTSGSLSSLLFFSACVCCGLVSERVWHARQVISEEGSAFYAPRTHPVGICCE